MFLCPYIVLKASSGVIFSVIFATRASIICIDSGTCDTIHISLALAIRFFNISINRYTPKCTSSIQYTNPSGILNIIQGLKPKSSAMIIYRQKF